MKRNRCCLLGTCLILGLLLSGCGRTLSRAAPAATATADSSAPFAAAMQRGNPPAQSGSKTPSSPSSTPLAVSSTPLPAPTPTLPHACAPRNPALVDTVVIGVILPLSSPGEYRAGFAMQAAINMALEDINESGGVRGRPLRVITYDSAGVPRQGALFAERLITLDCAQAIVGLFHSNVATAVSDVASRYEVPLILAAPRADELTADRRAAVFRLAPAHAMQDQALTAWLIDVVAAHADPLLVDDQLTVFIVAENRQEEREEVEHLAQGLQEAGFAPATFFVDLPTQDYSPVIARIVTMDMFPDVVVNNLRGQPSFDFHHQLLRAGVSPKNGTIVVTGEDALDDAAFWSAIPNGINSVVAVDGPWGSSVTPMGRAFADDYQAQFGLWPESYAFAAYDALRIMADTLDRTETWTFPALIQTLEAADLSLAAGRYHFPYNTGNPPGGVSGAPDYLWHQWPDPPLLFLEYTEQSQPAADMPVLWPPVYRTADGPYIP